MKIVTEIGMCFAVMFVQSITFGAEVTGKTVRCEGISSATAAVAVSEDLFVAACPEDNVLRVYDVKASGRPVASLDLSGYLGVDPDLPVVVAGAAKLGARVYWITSHGRDARGRMRPERYRFFATKITEKNERLAVEPVGKPCKILMQKLVNRNTVRTLGLNRATELGMAEVSKLAPEDEGLNIGALCASHNLNMLYIALRNPRPVRVTTGRPHALIVPLDNPAEVVEEGIGPIFGEGMLWDLDGLGISAFEYSPAHRAYFAIATPHNAGEPCVMYGWSGMKANPPELIALLKGIDGVTSVSTIVAFAGREDLLLLGANADGTTLPSFSGFWCRPQ